MRVAHTRGGGRIALPGRALAGGSSQIFGQAAREWRRPGARSMPLSWLRRMSRRRGRRDGEHPERLGARHAQHQGEAAHGGLSQIWQPAREPSRPRCHVAAEAARSGARYVRGYVRRVQVPRCVRCSLAIVAGSDSRHQHLLGFCTRGLRDGEVGRARASAGRSRWAWCPAGALFVARYAPLREMSSIPGTSGARESMLAACSIPNVAANAGGAARAAATAAVLVSSA